MLPESYNWIFEKPTILCYSLKEIICEKVRAILTRQGVKSRDFIDIFMIEQKISLNVENFEKEILEKIKDSLINEKYMENLNLKQKNIPTYQKGEEEKILLLELDKDFYERFLERFNKFLIQIIKKL